MKPNRLIEIADALDAKAEDIGQGFYGSEDRIGDDEKWELDLRTAAKKLRANKLEELTDSELEEIQFCSSACVDDSEMGELRP